MRIRGLLMAVVALVLLAGGVWWSNKAKKDEAAKSPAGASPAIWKVPQDDIARIAVHRRDGETTVLEKSAGGDWNVTSPKPYRADKDAVSSLVSALAALDGDKLVEEKAGDLQPFHLHDPLMTVNITLKDGSFRKLKIGDEVPAGGGTYAQPEGDARVLTLASWTKTSLDKNAGDLRDKRLVIFEQDKIARVSLAAKNTTTEFGRNNRNEWQILKPAPMRAENFQVEELIRRLRDAKLDPAVSEADAKKNAAAFASAARVALASVTDAAGTQTLEVRKTKDNKYLARGSAAEGIHSLASDIGEGLDKSAEDFRNKKVFDFGFSDPERVEFRSAARTLVLAKSGDQWLDNGKPMDPVGVQSLIDKMRDLQAARFPSSGPQTADIQLTVVSNQGQRTEKVSLSKSGENWIARREGEPALYEIAGAPVSELEKAAADVKAQEPAKKDADKKK
jgi:ribosomal protein L12E/L44/L45/RPP1/RPP2